MKFWLMKSEPDVFSWEDLIRSPGQKSFWEGVRNYQARNFMRDEMKVGDLAFFYHSSCPNPGVAGVMEVVSAATPDKASWDSKSEYFDPKSTPENPRWFGVEVRARLPLVNFLSLSNLREIQDLQDMLILRKGNRLSITPVDKKHFKKILQISKTNLDLI